MILISKFNLVFNLVMAAVEMYVGTWALNNAMQTNRASMLWAALVAFVIGIFILATTFNIGESRYWNGRVFRQRVRYQTLAQAAARS